MGAVQKIYYKCYIAGVIGKRDWLICGHVASVKRNVSRQETSKKLLPDPRRLRTCINKMAAQLASSFKDHRI